MPDGLLDTTLSLIAVTRQRPALLVPETWLSPRLAQRSGGLRRTVGLLAMIALVIALATALAVIVGSQHRLPPPFGLARPGLITFDLAGDIFVGNANGTGRMQLTSGPALDYRPTFSPDGTLIAYESTTGSEWSLVVMTPDGKRRTSIVDHWQDPLDLVWSPDSRRVAFGGNPFDSPGSHVFIAEADQPGARALGGPGLAASEPAWSPDGKFIAFKNLSAPEGLWIIGSDGSNPHRLSATTGSGDAFWNTQWSPDGTRLAFLAGPSGSHDVWVIDADGTGERNISNSPDDEYWPAWSPDGARIAFARMPPSSSQGTLVVVNPDGSGALLLGGAPVNSNTLVWSPDGKRILGYVVDEASGIADAIAVFDASGSSPPVLIPALDLGGATWQRLAP